MRRWVLVISAAFAIQLISAGSLSAASFQGLGFLPGGGGSVAKDVSGDGSVVVGYGDSANSSNEAFRWTAGGGIEGLGDLAGGLFLSEASSISADGSTIVGFSYSANGREAFRWTASEDMVDLGDLPGSFRSMANGVSADGSVIVGYSFGSNSMAFYWTNNGGMVPLGNGSDYVNLSVEAISSDGLTVIGQGGSHAARWTAQEGMVSLGLLPGVTSGNSYAYDVSADGSVIVGDSSSLVALHNEAFRWTSDAGMIGLGLPDGAYSSKANGVSADGSIVVGYFYDGDVKAFIWDSINGMRDIADILAAEGIDMTGWELDGASAVSADGRFIVGTGYNPAGDREAWIAEIPEPATLSLLGVGFFALLRRRR